MRNTWPRWISRVHGSPAGQISSTTARAGSSLLATSGIGAPSGGEIALGVDEAPLVFGTRVAAMVVGRRGARAPRDEPDRSRGVYRTRVERMHAGGQRDQCVHLEAQVDTGARGRVPDGEMQVALVVGGDLAEEVHRRG